MSKPKSCRKYDTFAKRLMAVRKEKGISQKNLADMARTSTQSMNQYELNRRIPQVNVAAEIAKSLGVSLDYLCGIDSSEIKMREYLYTLTQTLKPFSATDTDSAVNLFLKGWIDACGLYRSGVLDKKIYDSVVKSLCDKYAPLVVKEQHIEEGKVND